jgi:hypothetical protein
MQSYFISQSNSYTFRIEPATTSEYTMSLQNMTTQINTTASLSGIAYNDYESMLSFTASISGAIVGAEYRATLTNLISGSSTHTEVWHGTYQIYASQSMDKAVYENQNKQYVSHISENKYVIID